MCASGTVQHVIAISGYGDPEMVYDVDAEQKREVPKLLFRRHEQRTDIPASKPTMDFAVTASAAQVARYGEGRALWPGPKVNQLGTERTKIGELHAHWSFV